MALIVGIDLGTTYSAVAKIDDTGRAVIVRDTDGANITPSVVSFKSATNTVTGQIAKKQIGQKSTFSRFKRDMGTRTSYESEWGHHSPTQLSTLVLRKLKDETEKVERAVIAEAVITIPANFSNEAREATLAAAKAAGLTVKYIINEPTAAAMYFAQTSGQQLSGVYAVFDVGGGTFDVSIVRANGKDIEVLATEGVSRLGGEDFDDRLAELVANKYQKAQGAKLDAGDFTRREAEELKRTLSRVDSDIVRVSGSAGRADIAVSRVEFEEVISTQIAQIEMLCETVIQEANINVGNIQAVILAGGSTRVPAIQQLVRRVFARDPVSFSNPDEVVALGAAIYAAYKADAQLLNPIQRAAIADVKIAEITSKYFGTLSLAFNDAKQSEQVQNSIVIKRGERLPAKTAQMFYTVLEGQTSVRCSVTEANSPESDPRFVRTIWEGPLGPLPGGRPASQPIEVTFSYDLNQVMHCAFKDVNTGVAKEVDISMASTGGEATFDIEKFTVE